MHKNTEIDMQSKQDQSLWDKSGSISDKKCPHDFNNDKLEDGLDSAGTSKASTMLPPPEDASKIYLANE